MRGKRHETTDDYRRQVEVMAGCGFSESHIALIVGVDEKTLRKHYRHQLDNGHVMANSQVAANLFRMATGSGKGSVAAAIFWAKTRMGWKEVQVTEIANKEGETFKVEPTAVDVRLVGI